MQDGPEKPRRYACSVQPHLPAAAFCTQCRRPYAGRFLSVLEDGRAVCYRCLADHGLRTLDAPSTANASGEDPAFAEGWWGAVSGVIRKPIQTIGRHAPTMSIRTAVTFGFVMCLIGSALPILWASVLSPDSVNEVFQRTYASTEMELSQTQMRTLLIVSLPFAAGFKLFLGSALLHLGMRVSGAKDARYKENLRALSLSSATLLCNIIPAPFGLLLVAVLWSRVMMRWTFGRYGIPPMRAMFALLPTLLLMSFL